MIDRAQNGFDGFKMVQQQQYDYVICDLQMPVMDGYEFAEKVKQHYSDKSTFFNVEENFNKYKPYLVANTAWVSDDTE